MPEFSSLWRLCLGLTLIVLCQVTHAENPRVVLERRESAVVLEPYAPNIVRVTLSLKKEAALAAPGYGFVANPAGQGWVYQHSDEADRYNSSRLTVSVAGV